MEKITAKSVLDRCIAPNFFQSHERVLLAHLGFELTKTLDRQEYLHSETLPELVLIEDKEAADEIVRSIPSDADARYIEIKAILRTSHAKEFPLNLSNLTSPEEIIQIALARNYCDLVRPITLKEVINVKGNHSDTGLSISIKKISASKIETTFL